VLIVQCSYHQNLWHVVIHSFTLNHFFKSNKWQNALASRNRRWVQI